jgi:hypothetical protein
MGKIALSQNISLDGVMQLNGEMQSPGPTDVPFKYTGWAVDFGGGPEGARFNYGDEVGLEQAQNSEALLLGRVTYEAMQAFWPTAEGELADRLNELPKSLDDRPADPGGSRHRAGTARLRLRGRAACGGAALVQRRHEAHPRRRERAPRLRGCPADAQDSALAAGAPGGRATHRAPGGPD